ncbi:hypothetical protein BDW22DRAFT_1359073, partial [Trametopsis cervina]
MPPRCHQQQPSPHPCIFYRETTLASPKLQKKGQTWMSDRTIAPMTGENPFNSSFLAAAVIH